MQRVGNLSEALHGHCNPIMLLPCQVLLKLLTTVKRTVNEIYIAEKVTQTRKYILDEFQLEFNVNSYFVQYFFIKYGSQDS